MQEGQQETAEQSMEGAGTCPKVVADKLGGRQWVQEVLFPQEKKIREELC